MTATTKTIAYVKDDAPTVVIKPPPRPPTRLQWREILASIIVAGVPTAVMATVAAIGSSGRSLWQNEYVAWYASRLSAADLWRLVNRLDMDKAAYFVGLHLWINVFGDSPAAMRTPSIAAMAVAAGATALIGRRLFGVTAGLLAGLLMACVPAMSRYGSEISSYAFVTAAVTVSTLLLLRAFDKPSTARWAAYSVAITCVGYLHFVALLILIPHWVAYRKAVVSHPDKNAPDWPVAAYFALFPIAPLIWVSHGQASAISWIKMTSQDIAAYPTNLFMSAPVAGTVGFAAVGGSLLLLARRNYRYEIGLLWLWAAIPPVLGALSFKWTHIFLPRYFLFTVPALALLFAAIATSIMRRAQAHRLVVAYVAMVLVAVVAVVSLPSQQQARQSPAGIFDLRPPVAEIAARQQPGDGVAFAGVDIRFYVREALAYELRGKPKPRDVFEQVSTVKRGAYDATECSEPAVCIRSTPRVWLISSASGDPTTQMTSHAVARVLRSKYTASSISRFGQIRVVLMVRKAPAPPARLTPAKPTPAHR